MFTDTVTRVGSGRPNDMNPVLQKFGPMWESRPFIKLTVADAHSLSHDFRKRLKPS